MFLKQQIFMSPVEMEDEITFCEKCGKQVTSIDEMAEGICESCKGTYRETSKYGDFKCWACEKQLITLSEIAQGICHSCKSSIIRQR
jgi:predicted RNA-binding Zn-ribbon protein involved in translation (DUF1610 family)